jgi:hypothetical protein
VAIKYGKSEVVGGCEQEIQVKRERTLVTRLLEHIEPYVRGDKLEFTNWAMEERNRLKEAGRYNTSCTTLVVFEVKNNWVINIQTNKSMCVMYRREGLNISKILRNV